MSARDLIAAAFDKDAVSFEDTLNAVMQEKMAAAVQARFSPAVYEEEVDLDESKDEEDWDEEDELEEALKIGSKVKIHAPGKDYHGKIGHVGEIRKRTYGTMAPSYTVDYREPGEDYNRSVSLSREKIKLHKEEVDQIDEISGAKLGTYLIKARKSEAELDKKRDDSYDKPNTPENKAERKAISRTLNKRRWGHGKALDKLTGSSFAKVHATEK